MGNMIPICICINSSLVMSLCYSPDDLVSLASKVESSLLIVCDGFKEESGDADSEESESKETRRTSSKQRRRCPSATSTLSSSSSNESSWTQLWDQVDYTLYTCICKSQIDNK